MIPGLLREGYGAVVSQLHLRLADPASTIPWVTSVYLGITVAALRGAETVDARGALAFALDPGSALGSRTVVETPFPPGAADGAGSAEIVRDLPSAIDVRVSADAPALLVLNDLAAPGWSAEVDGREAPIATANYLARAVFVPPGEHTVAFRYRTPGLGAGLLLAALGGAALAGWEALRRRGRVPPT